MLIHKLLFNLASWHFKRYRKLTLVIDRIHRQRLIRAYKRRLKRHADN